MQALLGPHRPHSPHLPRPGLGRGRAAAAIVCAAHRHLLREARGLKSRLALSPRGCVHPERHLEGVPFSNFHRGVYSLVHGPGPEHSMTDLRVPGKRTRARTEATPGATPAPHFSQNFMQGECDPIISTCSGGPEPAQTLPRRRILMKDSLEGREG